MILFCTIRETYLFHCCSNRSTISSSHCATRLTPPTYTNLSNFRLRPFILRPVNPILREDEETLITCQVSSFGGNKPQLYWSKGSFSTQGKLVNFANSTVSEYRLKPSHVDHGSPLRSPS